LTQADAHLAGWLQCPVCRQKPGTVRKTPLNIDAVNRGESDVKKMQNTANAV